MEMFLDSWEELYPDELTAFELGGNLPATTSGLSGTCGALLHADVVSRPMTGCLSR